MKKSENTFKEDVRVIRTLKKIEDAFFHLLQKEDYKEIKLQDIYEIAGINRSTFYRHFKDKEDLVLSIISAREEHLRNMLKSRSSEREGKVYSELINNIYETILSEGKELKLLMKLTGNLDFRLHCLQILRDSCLDILSSLGEDRNSARSSYISVLYATSVMESITWMLENGKEHKEMVIAALEDVYKALGLRYAG